MRAVIIDKDKEERESLVKDLEMYCPDVEVIAQSDNPIEGRQLIHELSPDILFLEIELGHPSINGISMLRMIGEKINFQVIYVTNHNDYYIEAVKLCLCHYLVKPLNKEELINVVGLAKLAITNPKERSSFPRFPRNKRPQLEIARIIRFEVEGNHTKVFLEGEKKPTMIWNMPLRVLEEQLKNHAFIRSHVKHLINEKYVKLIEKDKLEIYMTNGDVIPISDRNAKKF